MAAATDEEVPATSDRDATDQPSSDTDCQTRPVAELTGEDRPRLAFFIPDLSVGGAEQVTVTIVNGLVTRGYEVDLLVSRLQGELRSELSELVTVVELPPSRTPVLGVAAHLPAIVTYLRRSEPAVLFPQLAHPSVVCLAINRYMDVDTAIIPTHHSAFGEGTNGTTKDVVVNRLVPRLYPAADRIVAVSRGVGDSIVDRTPVESEDLSVLHNPVDVAAIRESAQEPVDHEFIMDDDTDVILFVGRHARQKDLGIWLRAFEQVHNQVPSARAVIVGKGPHREELLTTIDERGLSDVVSVPGFVQNPYKYMNQADVFLLSSRYEGLPTVLIEALAVGCPVVSTDCPSGPREILDDGDYGRLVPVSDSAGLADAVVETLADPGGSERLRDRANDFAPNAVLDEYERFIQKHVTRT
ncbi:glycosyltransferase [Haloarcula litorea]|uniref:glycosyltransferase n=1 Tax=Haloarcula litorea TaxID=3032579 RepID=UPI00300FFBD4